MGKKIVDYLKAHKGIPHKEIQKPLRSVKVQGKDSFIIQVDQKTQQFDRDLLEELLGDKRMLFKVILGANYMDVQGLLHLGCAGVASLIKGKSPEEIKQILAPKDVPVEVQSEVRGIARRHIENHRIPDSPRSAGLEDKKIDGAFENMTGI